jgi:hypothetical protein
VQDGNDLAQVRIGIGQKTLDAGTEIVQARLAVGGLDEAVLRTLAVAGKVIAM